MIADPLTKLHCCIRSDGGGAVVLTDRGPGPRLREGARCGCSAPGEAISHTTMSEWDDFTESPARGRASWPSSGPGSRPTTSTSASSTTRSRRWCCSRSRRSGSARRARAARSSRTAGCASAARCRPTPTAAGCRRATPACAGMFLLVEAVAAAPRRGGRPPGAGRRDRLRQRHRRLVLVGQHRDPRSGVETWSSRNMDSRNMDFTLTPDQELLRDSARSLLTKECPTSLVRAHTDDPSAADPLWKHLREWTELGAGPLVDLCLFLEETGAVLAPGPFFATTALYAPLLDAIGVEDGRRCRHRRAPRITRTWSRRNAPAWSPSSSPARPARRCAWSSGRPPASWPPSTRRVVSTRSIRTVRATACRSRVTRSTGCSRAPTWRSRPS